jgi:hypothetical protein
MTNVFLHINTLSQIYDIPKYASQKGRKIISSPCKNQCNIYFQKK